MWIQRDLGTRIQQAGHPVSRPGIDRRPADGQDSPAAPFVPRRALRFFTRYAATYLERDVRQSLRIARLRDFEQFLRAKTVSGTAAKIVFWRDVHGVEVDFVVKHEGRLRLNEAKWASQVATGREVAPLLKVREKLRPKAAATHWIAGRPARPHALPGQPAIRVLNGLEFAAWFSA